MVHRSILIKQDGFYLVEWDLETNAPSNQTKIAGKLSSFFGYFAEFDQNITVKTFIEVIGDFTDEINAVFNGYLNEVDFDLFVQEVQLLGVKPPQIDYIELAWKVRMIAATDMTILDIIPNIIGISEIQGSDSDVVTELDFINLRELSHFMISEQTALDIPNDKTYKIAVEAERRWTLFDLLSGFFSEIAKFGSPEEKHNMIEELNKESKLSFSELMDYVDEIEQLKNDIENSEHGDSLDDDVDDE